MPPPASGIADSVAAMLMTAPGEARIDEMAREIQGAGAHGDEAVAELGRRGLLARLLPGRASPAGARLLHRIMDATTHAATQRMLADALLGRGADYDQYGMEQLVLRAEQGRTLPALLQSIVDEGRYLALRDLLTAGGVADSPALRAVAGAREDWDEEILNAPTIAWIHRFSRSAIDAFRYHALVVPGYTPLDTTSPLPLSDASRRRAEQAARDLAAALAPVIIVSGGAVYPAGTRANEALGMRAHLIALGVSPERILVDPYARHSPTNLRNAGRVLFSTGLSRALIVTGFETGTYIASQTFYFAHPVMSTFHMRCRAELGYEVGELDGVDEYHVTFRPAPEVTTPLWRDPLDW